MLPPSHSNVAELDSDWSTGAWHHEVLMRSSPLWAVTKTQEMRKEPTVWNNENFYNSHRKCDAHVGPIHVYQAEKLFSL